MVYTQVVLYDFPGLRPFLSTALRTLRAVRFGTLGCVSVAYFLRDTGKYQWADDSSRM